MLDLYYSHDMLKRVNNNATHIAGGHFCHYTQGGSKNRNPPKFTNSSFYWQAYSFCNLLLNQWCHPTTLSGPYWHADAGVHGLLMRLKLSQDPSRMFSTECMRMRGFCKQYWFSWKLFIFVSAYVGFR